MKARVKACAALGTLGLATLVASGCGGSHWKKEATPETTTVEEIAHEAADECDDGKDNDEDGFADCDDLDCRTDAREHCRFAPKLDRTVPTNLRDATSFLYTAPDPVQKHLDQDKLDVRRLSVIHGKVVGPKGKALRDVRVSVKDHPELGYSMSRSDGRYDLVVNGGGVVVLTCERQGYLSAARAVATEWQREHVAPDVGLVPVSTRVHEVRVGKAQVVRATKTDDDWGARQPFIVFEKGTEVDLLLAEGEHKALSSLHLRVTEYPFDTETPPMPGGNPRFLPGSLPSSGSITYSLDFTVDEATEFEATRVEFSKPVAYYVENFLGLPVGSPVPLRSYDAKTSEWETLEAGRVVEVVGVRDNKAELDIDGDGEADGSKALAKLGVTSTELAELGSRFEKGATLWRHEVEHFSAFTDAWNLVAPSTAVPPVLSYQLKQHVDTPSERGNVLVEPQVVRETVGLAGTPYSLVYQADRSTGYGAAYHVSIPLLGDSVPVGLRNVYVLVEIAGKLFPADPADRSRAPEPGAVYDFLWNGRDAFEQVLQGAQIARVWIGYGFEGLLPDGISVEMPQDAESLGLPDALIWSHQDVPLGVLDAQGFQFGGFGLDVQHAYDPVQGVIYFGDGTQRSADGVHLMVVAMDQTDPGAATSGDASRHLEAPDSVAVGQDGSSYVSDDGDDGRVWRIAPDGSYTTVLGQGASGAAGQAELLAPQGVAIDPTDGTLYVVDWEKLVVWRLRSSGAVDLLLGDDSSAVIRHALDDPDGVAVGPNHELYLADANKVWKIQPNQGTIEEPPYVGGVELGTSYELPLDISKVERASQVPLDQAGGVVIDLATGTLFVSSRKTNQVWRIEPNGTALLVAGTSEPGFSGDGLLAVDAQLNGPRGLALGSDGSVYIVDQENGRVRRVFPNGQITTVVGGGGEFPASVLPGAQAQLSRPDGLAFGPNGVAYVGGALNGDEPPHLFRASSSTGEPFGSDEYLVPSSDGKTAYRFDQVGRHLETIDVLTGKPVLSFEYDSRNRLIGVIDLDGLETTISRNGDGRAANITGPYGQENELGYDDSGNLVSVSAAIDSGRARERRFEYDSQNGLLVSASSGGTGDADAVHYAFDELGRAAGVTGPMGLDEAYASESATSGQRVDVVIPGASDGKDTYEQKTPSATLYEGFSFEDRDGHAVSGEERTDNTFELKLPGGAVVTGLMAASDQWGKQVRYPSEVILTTPGGKKLSGRQSIVTTGLEQAADGTVVDPLTFESQQTSIEVDGRVYNRTYDRRTRTLTTVSPEGRTSTIQYDERGRPERVEAPGAADTVYEYDDDGRIVSVTHEADGQTRAVVMQYGGDGLARAVTNAMGDTTHYQYDGLGRTQSITAADGAVTTLGYDDNDHVVSLVPPSRPAHTFEYEQHTGLIGYRPPRVGATANNGFVPAELRFDHDDFGRPVLLTRADGSTIEKHYFQNFYRPSQIWVSPGLSDSTDEYYLTLESNRHYLKSIYGPVNGMDYTYDSPLLTKVEPKGPSASGIINFTYDGSFRISRIKLTGSDATDYAYDNDSLLVQAGPLSIVRDPSSGLVTGTSVGAISTTEAQNGFGELMEYMADFNGTPLFAQTMERDELGRITRLTETNQGITTTQTYTYDEAGRLKSATTDGDTISYYYDPNGNRYPNAALAGASYDAQDRVEFYGDLEFESTDTGDVVRRTNGDQSAGYELVYSPLGALVRATALATGITVKYETDPLGRRVGRKVGSGKPKGWLYSDGLRVVAEIDDNAARTVFIYGERAHVPELIVKGGKTYRLITDHLGSVRLVVDVQTGTVTQEIEYDAWGKVINDTAPGFQPFGFAGGLYDPETGLVRFGARDYDPDIGRWTTRDPVGFNAGYANVYAYLGNDPVNGIDPMGTQGNPQECAKLLKTIENIQQEIRERTGELDEDRLGLPETHPNDDLQPSLSKRGHRRLLNEHKANLARRQAEYLAKCGPPPGGAPAPGENWLDWKYWEKITGLTGFALLVYLILSEGSRLIPVRNLAPIP